MSDPYVGEIRMFGGNFAPKGWNFCNGQVLPIAQNEVLFTLIGTTYGGDGVSTFALPDLRGRAPVHQGPRYVMGQAAGSEMASVSPAQMPAHTHTVAASTAPGTVPNPAGAIWAVPTDPKAPDIYAPSADGTMNPAAVQLAGASQPHENMMPFVTMSFIICMNGIFPTQN